MAGIVRIDDEVITTDDFIRTLKLSGQFEGLVEQMVRDRLTAPGRNARSFEPAHVRTARVASWRTVRRTALATDQEVAYRARAKRVVAEGEQLIPF